MCVSNQLYNLFTICALDTYHSPSYKTYHPPSYPLHVENFYLVCSFSEVIGYSLHDLNLGGKTRHIVGCLLQQATHIHGFPTWYKLSKLFGLAWLPLGIILDDPFLLQAKRPPSDYHIVAPCTGSKLEKKGPAPSPPRPNCARH